LLLLQFVLVVAIIAVVVVIVVSASIPGVLETSG
jgi:hypothetical protein